MILEIKGSSDTVLEFEGLVLGPFLNKGLNFAILQESGKLPNLIDGLHSSIIGFDKNCDPSFRIRSERLSIPAALWMFVLLKIFSMTISVVYVKWKASVKTISVGRSWEFFQKIAS